MKYVRSNKKEAAYRYKKSDTLKSSKDDIELSPVESFYNNVVVFFK